MWFYFWRFNFCNFSRVGWFSWCRGEATRGSELLGIARQWPRGCGRSRLLPSKWILLVSPIASVAKIGVHAGVGVPLMLLNTCRAYSVHLWGSKHGRSYFWPCNFSKAPALVSAGTQVEVMLLGGQGLSGLRGSDQAVLGICCPERVMFQAQGGPTLSKGRSYFWRQPLQFGRAGSCRFGFPRQAGFPSRGDAAWWSELVGTATQWPRG